MTTSQSIKFVPVQTQGAVAAEDVQYARAKIEGALHYARDPVLFVRARLTQQPDRAVERPALAQVNVDLNGRPVRAQVACPTLREAVDELHDRLRDRLERAARDREGVRGSGSAAEAHEWRLTGAQAEPARSSPRTVDEPQVVRRKTYALGRLTVDEAASDIEMLGYEFHLFTEDGSGVDSVLHQASDGSGYRLSQLDPQPDQVARGTTAVTVSSERPPTLTAEQAAGHLSLTGLPFVFFRDAETGGGCVLYHRYDGDYGLITTAS